jgi:hypothetical protein
MDASMFHLEDRIPDESQECYQNKPDLKVLRAQNTTNQQKQGTKYKTNRIRDGCINITSSSDERQKT